MAGDIFGLKKAVFKTVCCATSTCLEKDSYVIYGADNAEVISHIPTKSISEQESTPHGLVNIQIHVYTCVIILGEEVVMRNMKNNNSKMHEKTVLRGTIPS